MNKTIAERLREYDDSSCVSDLVSRIVSGNIALCRVNEHGFDCGGCRKEWIGKLADAIEVELNQSKSTGLPEGVIWPTFEDGSPVKFGDEFVNNKGNTTTVTRISLSEAHFTINKGAGRICKTYGNCVKRPEPEVLDADGVPIKVGDTVWDSKGKSHEVVSIEDIDDEEQLIWCGKLLCGIKVCHIANELTHRKPDSQEAIDDDMTLSPNVYWEKVLGNGSDEAADYATLIEAMCADLLRRQRELLRR